MTYAENFWPSCFKDFILRLYGQVALLEIVSKILYWQCLKNVLIFVTELQFSFFADSAFFINMLSKASYFEPSRLSSNNAYEWSIRLFT